MVDEVASHYGGKCDLAARLRMGCARRDEVATTSLILPLQP